MYTLKNKLLVSMPNMTDPYFAKSVIFICEYNNDGAIGFIINKPVSTMKIISSGIKDKFFKDLLSQSKKIYFGGPVSIHEACILSDKNTKNALLNMSKKIKLSNDLELIKKILFLLENNLKAEIMGENACLHIKKNFSWSKIALDFSRIITKHSDLFISKKRNNNL